MANEMVIAHLRRARRWSLLSALLITSAPIFEYLATGNTWPFRLTAVCAAFAWINLIAQSRALGASRE